MFQYCFSGLRILLLKGGFPETGSAQAKHAPHRVFQNFLIFPRSCTDFRLSKENQSVFPEMKAAAIFSAQSYA